MNFNPMTWLQGLSIGTQIIGVIAGIQQSPITNPAGGIIVLDELGQIAAPLVKNPVFQQSLGMVHQIATELNNIDMAALTIGQESAPVTVNFTEKGHPCLLKITVTPLS